MSIKGRPAAMSREERVERVANYIRAKFKEIGRPVIIPRTIMSQIIQTSSVQEHQSIRYAVAAEPDILMELAKANIPKIKRPYAYSVIEGEKPLITAGALRSMDQKQLDYLQEKLYEKDKPNSRETYAKMCIMSDLFLMKNKSNEWAAIDYDYFRTNLVVENSVIQTFLSFMFDRMVWARKEIKGGNVYKVAFSEADFKAYMAERISPNISIEDVFWVEDFRKSVQRSPKPKKEKEDATMNEPLQHQEPIVAPPPQSNNDLIQNAVSNLLSAISSTVSQQMQGNSGVLPSNEVEQLKKQIEELKKENAQLLSEQAVAKEMIQEGRQAFVTLQKATEKVKQEADIAKRKLKIYKGYEKEVTQWKQQIQEKVGNYLDAFSVGVSEDVMKYGNSMPSATANTLKSSLMRHGMNMSDNINRAVDKILNPGREDND